MNGFCSVQICIQINKAERWIHTYLPVLRESIQSFKTGTFNIHWTKNSDFLCLGGNEKGRQMPKQLVAKPLLANKIHHTIWFTTIYQS
jgi:hypothetical protein